MGGVVTAKTQYNLKNAREYFEEHLCVGDYYDEGQRVAGEWTGLGATRLGLSGKVRAADFLRLCENQHPDTCEKLTQRLNTTRTEGDQSAANRRIFYDFTFSLPKSVSLASFLGEDQPILQSHARAVRSALNEFEKFAATRVRVGGARNERLIGNFVAAQFTHDTSRALDPHMHTHCIVFNATFDAVENRWKALENYELLRAWKFAENVYYHELARELKGFGYRIRNRARGDFEIEGVSEELCQRFSKRDAEIDAALTRLLADHPELAEANSAELRSRVAQSRRGSRPRNHLPQVLGKGSAAPVRFGRSAGRRVGTVASSRADSGAASGACPTFMALVPSQAGFGDSERCGRRFTRRPWHCQYRAGSGRKLICRPGLHPKSHARGRPQISMIGCRSRPTLPRRHRSR